MRTSTALVVRAEAIERRIYILRGQKVMLDSDLASLYGVETKHLNQAVTRNRKRFPADFMFQLNAAEACNLKSQIVTSSWGGARFLPYAFTEQPQPFRASPSAMVLISKCGRRFPAWLGFHSPAAT